MVCSDGRFRYVTSFQLLAMPPERQTGELHSEIDHPRAPIAPQVEIFCLTFTTDNMSVLWNLEYAQKIPPSTPQ